ncbi:hypothetical protein D7Z26_22025 [Cohnella endophytica]|uniref:Uncharacterized protein n=1 Tax=Cohnella endophytica TaxID=2419778 RepID=A0A494XII1_9BACL|nr:hypothetical protein [Cohnella endophytica]RKP47894.1 hypothetical protein D7Z26_22025 [Cohnella endophytica]
MTSEMDTLKNILNHVVSMELRVKNAEIKSTIEMMDGFGLRYKNSWASMELSDHTVIDFWRKDLIKSSHPNE